MKFTTAFAIEVAGTIGKGKVMAQTTLDTSKVPSPYLLGALVFESCAEALKENSENYEESLMAFVAGFDDALTESPTTIGKVRKLATDAAKAIIEQRNRGADETAH